MKPFITLLIALLGTGCFTNYDEPWVLEVNGTSISIPPIGIIMPKTIRNSLRTSSLTAEQTKILESALPVVMNAVYFSYFENHATDKRKKDFADAQITFYYQFLTERLIKDRQGGFSDIKHWDITPTTIAFTLYHSMWNESDDGYGIGGEDYHIKFRYYFAKDEQGEWQFIKNIFSGFDYY